MESNDDQVPQALEADHAAAWACEQTVLRFSAHFDAGKFAQMMSYFADDGIWKRADGDIHGIDALRAWCARRAPGVFVRHVLSNLRTTMRDADNAVVESYVTVYRRDFDAAPVLPAPMQGPALVGRYRDELVRHGGQWKLARREVRIDFKLEDRGAA